MKRACTSICLLVLFFGFGSVAVKINGQEVPDAANNNQENVSEGLEELAELENILLVGNPGVGKSTLINSIFGEVRAIAGVNPGTGITTIQEGYNYKNRILIDTPGLSDVKTRAKSAKEIENALKRGGKYRIIFVLQLSAGRIRDEDVSTITTVMDAINIPNVKYNVLFNKVTKRELIEIMKDVVKFSILVDSINSGKYKTQSIWYVKKDNDLEDGDSDFINIDPVLKNYIFKNSLVMDISPEKVLPLDADSFEAVKAKAAKATADLVEQKRVSDENQRLYEKAKEQVGAAENKSGGWCFLL